MEAAGRGRRLLRGLRPQRRGLRGGFRRDVWRADRDNSSSMLLTKERTSSTDTPVTTTATMIATSQDTFPTTERAPSQAATVWRFCASTAPSAATDRFM